MPPADVGHTSAVGRRYEVPALRAPAARMPAPQVVAAAVAPRPARVAVLARQGVVMQFDLRAAGLIIGTVLA